MIVSERRKRPRLEHPNLQTGFVPVDGFALSISAGRSKPQADCQHPQRQLPKSHWISTLSAVELMILGINCRERLRANRHGNVKSLLFAGHCRFAGLSITPR